MSGWISEGEEKDEDFNFVNLYEMVSKQSWPSTKLSLDTSLNLMSFVTKNHERALRSVARPVLHLRVKPKDIYSDISKITGGASFQFKAQSLKCSVKTGLVPNDSIDFRLDRAHETEAEEQPSATLTMAKGGGGRGPKGTAAGKAPQHRQQQQPQHRQTATAAAEMDKYDEEFFIGKQPVTQQHQQPTVPPAGAKQPEEELFTRRNDDMRDALRYLEEKEQEVEQGRLAEEEAERLAMEAATRILKKHFQREEARKQQSSQAEEGSQQNSGTSRQFDESESQRKKSEEPAPTPAHRREAQQFLDKIMLDPPPPPPPPHEPGGRIPARPAASLQLPKGPGQDVCDDCYKFENVSKYCPNCPSYPLVVLKEVEFGGGAEPFYLVSFFSF